MGWIVGAALAMGGASAEDRGVVFDANVLVVADGADRVAIVIDPDADGTPDSVVWATARRADRVGRDIGWVLPLALDGATVSISTGAGVRVTGVDARGDAWAVLARTGAAAAERFALERDRNGRRVLRLEGGAAVTHVDLSGVDLPDGARMDPESARELTREFPTVERSGGDVSQPGGDNCASGGPGASSCSQSCGGGVGVQGRVAVGGAGVSGTVSASCNVTCGAGFHACCECGPRGIRFLTASTVRLAASCVCVENEEDDD
jgi:hypothetical protein